MDDEALVARVKDSDDSAFAVLLDRHRSLIARCVKPYFLPGAESEDLLQDGAVGLFKAARDYRPAVGVPFAKFARLCITRQVVTAVKGATTGKSRLLNYARSIEAPLVAGDDAGETLGDLLRAPASYEPEHHLEQALEDESFQTWCRTILSPLERQIADAFVAGGSYTDIAAAAGLSAKSVDNALQRVRRKLRVQLRADRDTPPHDAPGQRPIQPASVRRTVRATTPVRAATATGVRQPLTARQQQVLECMLTFTATHTTPPSIRELATALGLASPATVVQHVRTLQRKGYLRHTASTATKDGTRVA